MRRPTSSKRNQNKNRSRQLSDLRYISHLVKLELGTYPQKRIYKPSGPNNSEKNANLI